MKREGLHIVVIGILCFTIAASICVQYRSVLRYKIDGEVSVQSMSENKLRNATCSGAIGEFEKNVSF